MVPLKWRDQVVAGPEMNSFEIIRKDLRIIIKLGVFLLKD